MFRNKSVSTHQFAMIPRADIPRSSFRVQTTHKTTFDSGYLVPVYVDEILPGDSFSLRMTAFARMSTPLFPIMDNCYLDSFFFFVPSRLVWTNFEKFMGEQASPADSISYVIPQIVSNAGGPSVGSIYDHFGLPTFGQVTAGLTYTMNALPFRCYNLIWQEWFRDENLQNQAYTKVDDGPDIVGNYFLLKRGKRHDYFTSCLPWPQKGASVSLPLGTTADIKTAVGVGGDLTINSVALGGYYKVDTSAPLLQMSGTVGSAGNKLYADLSTATAATINQLRQSFQIQRLLERDARGGTRYVEIVRSHFGVISPDARLQRPEYLGGGSTPISINPIAQTSATGLTGGSTPVGALSAMGTAISQGNGFSQSFTEHGYIIGLVSVRADLTYQQGIRKMWSRSTRYDFYFPAFSHLGEQAVLNKEIYCVGGAAGTQDDGVFGYQERWSEYRHYPSQITGLFKSTSSGTIDPWHLAQKFTALPTLNSTFIEETPPFQRIMAVGAAAAGKEFIFDAFFDIKEARPMPLYSVPGLIDHF